MFGPRDFYNFTYSIENTSMVKINYDQQLYGFKMEYIVLTFIDRFTTTDITNNLEMVNTQFTFELEGKEVDSNASILATLGMVTFFLFIIVAVLFIVGGFLGYPIGILLDIVGTLQLVHLFPVARLYLPTGLFKFFKWFEYLNFQQIGIGLWDYDQIIDSNEFTINGNEASYNFKKMGFTSNSFFMTSSDVIICAIYLIIIPVVVRIMAQFLSKFKIMRNMERNIVFTSMPIIFNLVVFILAFTSLLNFIEFNVETRSESAGSLASYF